MGSDIDYSAVEVPQGKAPTAYTYVERRAELLQLVFEAGHPRALNQTELAERYGVSQQQISKDMDRLAEYVADHLGERHAFVMESVLHGAMLNLIEEGEYYRAAQVARWWGEWLGDIGVIQTEPERHEIAQTGSLSLTDTLDEEDEVILDWVTHDAGNEATDVEIDDSPHHRGEAPNSGTQPFLDDE